MRVFSSILIQLGQLVKSKLWMVSQGDVQDQNPEVVIIQEGLSNLYIQIDQRMNVLHVALYIKLENALLRHLFVSNVTNQAIFQDDVDLPPVHPVPMGIQWDHGMAEVEAVIGATETVDPNVLYTKLKCQTLQNP